MIDSAITAIRLPDFDNDGDLPSIPVDEYRSRLDRTTDRMRASDLDVLVVYADREHSANLCFLTGFDPRFEEALLLMDVRGHRLLIVGNECLGYLPNTALDLDVELFQEFSLLGQQRDASRPLRAICSDFGIRRGICVGCVGWKYFAGALVDVPDLAMELPAYIVDMLRDLTGERQRVRNVGAMFMDPADGLRVRNSVDQIARFEYASIRTSEGVSPDYSGRVRYR